MKMYLEMLPLDCLDPAWDSSYPAGLGPLLAWDSTFCSRLACLHCTLQRAPNWRLAHFTGSGSLWLHLGDFRGCWTKLGCSHAPIGTAPCTCHLAASSAALQQP